MEFGELDGIAGDDRGIRAGPAWPRSLAEVTPAERAGARLRWRGVPIPACRAGGKKAPPSLRCWRAFSRIHGERPICIYEDERVASKPRSGRAQRSPRLLQHRGIGKGDGSRSPGQSARNGDGFFAITLWRDRGAAQRMVDGAELEYGTRRFGRKATDLRPGAPANRAPPHLAAPAPDLNTSSSARGKRRTGWRS